MSKIQTRSIVSIDSINQQYDEAAWVDDPGESHITAH